MNEYSVTYCMWEIKNLLSLEKYSVKAIYIMTFLLRKNYFHEIFAKNDSESKHYSVSTLVMNANFLKFSLVRLLGFNLVLSLNSTA